MQRETFDLELEQHRIDCLASHGDLTNWKFLKKKLKTFTKEGIKPAPLLTGRDILDAGYAEGPVIGTILRKAEEAQLEGELKTKDEALDWLKSNRGKLWKV
jgi:poly(A) polymerase